MASNDPAASENVENESPFQSDEEVLDEAPASGIVVELNADDTEVDFTHCGLTDLSVLQPLGKLEVVGARRNRISCIGDNLTQSAESLKEVDLYDNRVEAIEAAVESFTNLEILDLSFNRVRTLENLRLHKLKRLFIASNRISKINELGSVPELTVLELGSNRLRKLEGMEELPKLEQLYVGRNKITSLQNLYPLVNLTLLSIQSNRLTKIEGLECLVNLDSLYLSHNGIEKVEGLENNLKLTTLDLGNNRVKKIENVSHLTALEEFWFNNNQISSWEDVQCLTNATNIQTVYLEANPIAKDPAYRRKLKLTLPSLTQIDATMC
ncbi:protein phosphatase 1 regulatory subunit 7-like [Sycon ciliatum]|uniref:protein phosphatase 1 regulatory subunit 7-like n=1 Tax=Sycon ciliatum TaxID=27933 RepID=UPI0031F65E1F